MKEARYACIALALGVSGSSAGAMTMPAHSNAQCHVIDGQKLPAASGGATALCDAIKRVAAARGFQKGLTVHIRVAPRSMLSADITLPDGRALATLHMAEMDRAVTRDTLNRFALAIADHITSGAR